jgi:hypothetical protein
MSPSASQAPEAIAQVRNVARRIGLRSELRRIRAAIREMNGAKTVRMRAISFGVEGSQRPPAAGNSGSHRRFRSVHPS